MLHTGLVDSGAKQPSDRIQTTASVFWFVGETWKLFDAHISVFNPNLWLSVSSLWYTLVGQWQLLLVNSGIQKVKQSICVWAESQPILAVWFWLIKVFLRRFHFLLRSFSNLSNSELLVAPAVLEAQAWTCFTAPVPTRTRFTSTGASWSVAMGRATPINSLVTAGHLTQVLPALSRYHCTSLTILYYGNFTFFSVQMMSSKLNFDSICLMQHDKVVVLSSAVTETWRQCCHKKESSCCRSDISLTQS